VAFLDSDDRWFPGKIAAEVAALRAHPQVVGVAYSSFYAVDDRGRLLNAAPQRTTCGIALDELLDGDDYLMPSLCTFDARIFAAIGTFNVGLYHEDHEFILRVAQRFPIVPTGRRLAVYRQSTSGKCRAILADYDRARTEELSVTRDLRGILSQTQIDRLHRNVIRSLYCRFLMYGFNASARRLLPEVDRTVLRATRKGTLAWLFAQTGVNLLVLARTVIQTFHLWARQGAWQQRLRALDVELRYD
jgi:hypothetical protein